MWRRGPLGAGVLVIALVLSGCVGSAPRASEPASESAPPRPSVTKRVTLAMVTEPVALRSQLSRSSAGSLPGSQELEQLVNAGLAILDHEGKLQPQLAETVPSVENGGWKVFPDGRMETVWKIRHGALWHDGQPVTAEDFVFTAMVAQDKDLAQFRNLAFDSVESVEAVNSTMVAILWSRPYIAADTLFAAFESVPVLAMPKHVLEAHYVQNKNSFADLAYWSDEFIGTGPYRLKELARGNNLVLTAVPNYVLGKPAVDEITVKFILDRSALAASLLAGDIDMPVGNSLSFEEAMQLKDQWRDGTVEFRPTTTLKLWPQFRNPNPRVVADVRFRRAMLLAIDRQQMADSLSLGQSPVSDSSLSPVDPEYEALKGSIVRYPYDPRAAAELLAELGYRRGADDAWRDTAGQRLTIEARTVPRDILIKSVLASVDDWKTLGIAVEPIVLTQQQRSDREFYATFPAFDAAGSNNGTSQFYAFHSSQAKTPENRYTGSNRSGYASAELDRFIDRFYATIPSTERMQIAGRIVNYVTDQLVFLPLFYDLSPTLVGNRLMNVPRQLGRSATPTWNAQQWDVKG